MTVWRRIACTPMLTLSVTHFLSEKSKANTSMNLSVAARVKAHISTPYIDADGRGTQGAYSSEYAECMRSPSEFHASQLGLGEIERALTTTETKSVVVEESLRQKVESIRRQDVTYTRSRIDQAKDHNEVMEASRAKTIDEDQNAEAVRLNTLFKRRDESESAMAAFESALKESDESKLRTREEAVRSRHSKLADLKIRAKVVQEDAARLEQERRAESTRANEAFVLKKINAIREADRVAIEEAARTQYESIVSDRAREAQLRKDEEAIRLRDALQTAAWSRDRKDALQRAERASEVALKAQRAMDDAEMEAAKLETNRSYEKMLEVHARLHALTAQLERDILELNGKRTSLNLLMGAARDVATARGVIFHGLKAVCDGTYVPGPYTPDVPPVPPKDMFKAVGSQTLVSEPVNGVPSPVRRGQRPSLGGSVRRSSGAQ